MPNKPSILMPALYGGIIMAVISAVPGLNLLNCLCCAGVMFGGLMAVFFYKKDLTAQTPLESSDGVKLGLLAGVFGAIIGSILTAGLMAVTGNVGGQMVKSMLESSGALDKMPPEAVEQMESGLRETSLSFFAVIMSLIIDPLFGLLGGLIGYAVFKSKSGAVVPQPPVQPPAQP